MKAPSKIQVTVWLFGLAGAALFTGLLIHQGVGQVLDAFATGEWAIMGIVVYHLIPIFLDALAWWVLFPNPDRPPMLRLFWMRWIGESVSTLVPSAAVGGDIVRARLAAIRGVPLPIAAGTVLVDLTLGIFIQAGFTLLGLVLLVDLTGKTSFVRPTLIGIVIALFAFAGFYFVQRMGMFRLDHCVARYWLGRNLAGALDSRFTGLVSKRADFAEHGFDHSLGSVSSSSRFGCAGRRLSCRRQSARHFGRRCFRSGPGRASA